MGSIPCAVGYDIAMARMQELRELTLGVSAPAQGRAPGALNPQATAALFQQQMITASMLQGDDDGSSGGDASTALPGLPASVPGMPGAAAPGAASANPYAALQGNGLSTQAALLAQITGGTATASTLAGLGLGPQGSMGTAGAAGIAPVATTAPSAPSLAHVTGKTANLDPELLSRLDALGQQLGKPIDIISGNRTFAEQSQLYAAYRAGHGNLAAPPGHSNHEHGAAADAYVGGVALANVPGARDAAQRLGLHFPVGGEAWHVERTDT
ncbi:MAG: penicillin-resistant DD-carboxypeptidase [Thermoleophilia bacterium]|nr:penicillin-resistant DD-carboxypeptidase [Thermoleophilia bacterium]